MTIPYHHCCLAIVALSRRYVLAQELRRRDQTRALYASDGSRSVRWLTPRSSFSQTLLTFGRTTIALLVTYCASQLFLANEQYTATSLVTNIGSPHNIDALGLFSVILSWALLSVLLVEQYFSILPLGQCSYGLAGCSSGRKLHQLQLRACHEQQHRDCRRRYYFDPCDTSNGFGLGVCDTVFDLSIFR